VKGRIACLMVLVFLSSCTGTPSNASAWQSPRLQSHPLTGQIWRSSDRSFIDRDTFLAEIRLVDYLLLGEKHDNPDHHLLRQQLLAQLQPELALVSFEMLDRTRQTQLDALASTHHSAEAVRTELDWDDEGWTWEYYGPLLTALLRDGVPVKAANISRAEVMEVYGGELNPIAVNALSAEQVGLLEQEIDASHCGMLPASQFTAMVRVQQARDFQMAQSLLSDMPGMRVLVAGNYHVRKDLGVLRYLRALGDRGEVKSVAFLEVTETLVDPHSYLETAYAADAFDYVWFTPAAEERDYCAAFQ
jgi:uncharacterized iron-regulated protein